MPNSWQLHELQHARLPCPSSPLSQWCSLTISSSVSPLFSCPQSSPASGSFPVSRLFTLGGQSIGVSASVLPMNIHSWFPLGLTGLISLQQSKGLSRVLLQHQSSKVSILQRSTFFMVQQLSHASTTTGKTIALTILDSDSRESTCQCRRPRFDSWVGKVPWRREWLPTPVFLPGESHGERSLAGYSPRWLKELDMQRFRHDWTTTSLKVDTRY